MSAPDPIRVNVDPTNPGQFFACCGLLELADRLWPGAEGWFEDQRFCIAGPVPGKTAITDLLKVLIECRVDVQDVESKTSPLQLLFCRPRIPIRSDAQDGEPETSALQLDSQLSIRLDWWLGADGEPNLFKTWAANATSQQMFSKWLEPLKRHLVRVTAQPEHIFVVSDRIQGSYGFDSHLGWDALNMGFSLNEHPGLKQLPTRPAAELLGAIGLQRFFPTFYPSSQVVRYSSWHVPLGVSVAGAAGAGQVAGVAAEGFRTRFVYRGSFKGLERAIPTQGAMND
jgi:CRISPR-associated protein Csb3